MTDELLSLIAVLDRCIAIEPRQDDVLRRICGGPLITNADLIDAGILPVPHYATRPPTVEDLAAPHLF